MVMMPSWTLSCSQGSDCLHPSASALAGRVSGVEARVVGLWRGTVIGDTGQLLCSLMPLMWLTACLAIGFWRQSRLQFLPVTVLPGRAHVTRTAGRRESLAGVGPLFSPVGTLSCSQGSDCLHPSASALAGRASGVEARVVGLWRGAVTGDIGQLLCSLMPSCG